MAVSGIQGLPLEVTVVGCINLKDKEWISREDPYVCVEYGSNRFRTKTSTDGGKNPSFQEKFVVSLIEGLRELNVGVWNSNTLSADDFIGSGRIQLHKVLSQGYDDSSWPVQDKCGRYSGEVRLILHYTSCGYPSKNKISPSAPLAIPGTIPAYPTASPATYPTYYASSPYPGYPPKSLTPTCPPPPYSAYPPTTAAYPPSTTYLPPAYPPHPSGYPTSTYPPPPVMYPPQYPPPPTTCYPPPPGPGLVYPPPPY